MSLLILQGAKLKTIIVAGAGSTLSDGFSKPLREKPPLDAGFFNACHKLGYSEMKPIIQYLDRNYDIDPCEIIHDSLERVMAIIYADIDNPYLDSSAIHTFRTLIKLFNRRIAETTNDLLVTYRSNLYRIIAKCLNEGTKPQDISVITFNQDLRVERTVEKLASTQKYGGNSSLFSFPHCYGLSNPLARMSTAPESVEQFIVDDEDQGGILIFKLHGSLNWFSRHTSSEVPKAQILSNSKNINITPRKKINPTMRFNTGQRTVYTFPLVIPPVNHKASIIHRDLHPIWKSAEAKLSNAERIIIFGYSCPPTDFESANLLRRSTKNGAGLHSFSVIDPRAETFQRYVEVTNLDHLSYFSGCDAFISKG